ncbi:MAG: hypothetical protein ACOC6J_00265 [Spirochaetota bacterium]
MGLSGKNRHDGDTQTLRGVLDDIDEQIEEQELVQYLAPGRTRHPLWGLLILTASSLVVVYGESPNVLRKLLRSGSVAHHRMTVRFDEIERIDLPPRGGLVRRLVQGPTRTASIVTRNGPPVKLEVDDPAARLVGIAASRAGGPA